MTSRAPVPAWACGEGDVLVGEVVGFDVGAGRFGGYMVLLVDVDEATERGVPVPRGEWRAVHCAARTLSNALERLKPALGYSDFITVRNRGRAVTKDGQRTYAVFELERERPQRRIAHQAAAERRLERGQQRQARFEDDGDARKVDRTALSQIGPDEPWPEDFF